MAIRDIRKVGDPVLRMKAKEVKKITDKTKNLIQDMFDTMYDAPGAGLAAPQVGVSQQIIVIDVDGDSFELINPVIIEQRGTQIGEEGCLSIPGERYLVNRADWVKVKGLNAEGQVVEVIGEAMLARALQHEIDHLNGVLFTDKIYHKKE